MVAAPEYDLITQRKIILALCVLHNFIRIHNPTENLGQEEEITRRVPRRNPEDFGQTISSQEKARANSKRDSIAKAMWQQYQEHIQGR